MRVGEGMGVACGAVASSSGGTSAGTGARATRSSSGWYAGADVTSEAPRTSMPTARTMTTRPSRCCGATSVGFYVGPLPRRPTPPPNLSRHAGAADSCVVRFVLTRLLRRGSARPVSSTVPDNVLDLEPESETDTAAQDALEEALQHQAQLAVTAAAIANGDLS